jgi:orotate phosphoribosyltransferase
MEGQQSSPLRLNFAFLPSYPELLHLLAEAVQRILEGLRVDRLVCTEDALPLGLAVGLKTNIPVVYAKGSRTSSSFELIGAYDIGHPAVLLVNALDTPAIPQLLTAARRVGLEIHTLIALIRTDMSQTLEIPTYSILRLEEVIEQLQGNGRLSRGQAEEVMNWVNRQAIG